MNYIEKNKEKYLEDLKGLIGIQSYLRDPQAYPNEDIKKAVDYLVSLGNREGFKSYADPDGYYGYIEIGEGEELIGILGHVDVVPPGEDSKWNTPPFELTEKEGNLFGRGTQDDKGPILLALYLMKEIVERGEQLNKRIRLIFPSDEESFWRGVEKYVEKEEIPAYGITPDSCFPLIYSERELYEFVVIGKPTTEFTLEGGSALNVVPDECKFKLNDEELITKGKAEHAMNPWLGENAIDSMIEQIKEKVNHPIVKFINEKINKECRGVSLFGKEIKDDDETISVNMAKVIINDKEAKIFFDLRIPNTSNKEEIESLLIDILKEYDLELEHYDFLPGVYVPKDSKVVKDLIESFFRVTGKKEEPIASGGATYARSMPNIVAYGPYFEDSPMTEHQYNEYARWEDFIKAYDIYNELFTNWLK